MLGDQTTGTNVEAPLATIKQAMAETLAGWQGSADGQPINIYIGEELLDSVIANSQNRRALRSGGNIFLMKMETESGIKTAIICLTLSIQQTGMSRKRWNTGGSSGRLPLIQNLRKKGWMCVSTTVPMCGRGLT